MAYRWPWWVTGWMLLSTLVVLWDVGFILNRPRSMAGGDLAWLWAPYPNYYAVDKAYGDVGNAWIVAQTYGNIFESGLNFVALFLYIAGKPSAAVVLLVAAVMTLWKTVLYMAVEAVTGWANIGHNSLYDLVIFFIIPNGFWIAVPLLIVLHSGSALSASQAVKTKRQ